jgi:hypothetical protein
VLRDRYQVSGQESSIALPYHPHKYCRRFVLINVLHDHLKANSRHSGKAKRLRSGGRYIDYPPAHKGTTVVDPNHGGAAGSMICYTHFCTEGQRPVSGGHFLRTGIFTTRGSTTRIYGSHPGLSQ